jgi:putative DNA primase/helicase
MMAALGGAVVDPMQFKRTDAGNALLFVAMYKEDIRYVEAWRTWAHWNGKRWELKSDIALLPLARKVTEHMFEWAATLATLTDEDDRQALRKHALATQREQRLHAMINLARGEPSIRAEPKQFDANPWLLGCADITVDLRARKSYLPRREDLITKSTGINPDPNAACPNWLATLNWAMEGDSATIEHLQRIAGYLLTGSVSEEKLFALFGGGANGKTTFAMTLFEALEEYAAKGRRDFTLAGARRERCGLARRCGTPWQAARHCERNR